MTETSLNYSETVTSLNYFIVNHLAYFSEDCNVLKLSNPLTVVTETSLNYGKSATF